MSVSHTDIYTRRERELTCNRQDTQRGCVVQQGVVMLQCVCLSLSLGNRIVIASIFSSPLSYRVGECFSKSTRCFTMDDTEEEDEEEDELSFLCALSPRAPSSLFSASIHTKIKCHHTCEEREWRKKEREKERQKAGTKRETQPYYSSTVWF